LSTKIKITWRCDGALDVSVCLYGSHASALNCKLHGEAMTLKGNFRDEYNTTEREIIGIYGRERIISQIRVRELENIYQMTITTVSKDIPVTDCGGR
jgi:hypothetical protein